VTTERHFDAEAGSRKRSLALLGVLGVLLAAVWWPGCKRYPEVSSREGLELMRALYTACSSRSEERLAKVERALEESERTGKVTPKEAKAFRSVIATARQGDWDSAASESFRFARDQVR
jgi:hypothetical protein